MSHNKPEELQRIIDRQKIIIDKYESVSSIYRFTKGLPGISRLTRFGANVLKSGKKSGTVVKDGVRSASPEIVAVVSPFFRGVRSATIEMVPDIFEVSEIFNRKEASKIAKQLLSHKPKKVLVSAYALGHDLLIEEIKRISPNVRVFSLIHSAFIWFDVYPAENKTFERFLELEQEGVIEKIGFCKKDVSEYFKNRGHNAFYVMNRFYPEKHSYKKLVGGKLKIGIWGSNLWHRNITNQVIAALMVPGAEIHVNEVTEHSFLDMTRINVHGFLPKEEYLELMSGMDINLYVSMTDCFPMTLVESMQFGIPAIASDTSDVYTSNKKLHDALVVSTVDGPLGIRDKILEVSKEYDSIQGQIKAYLPKLKDLSEQTIEEFLK